jgi:hypothetical protein
MINKMRAAEREVPGIPLSLLLMSDDSEVNLSVIASKAKQSIVGRHPDEWIASPRSQWRPHGAIEVKAHLSPLIA